MTRSPNLKIQKWGNRLAVRIPSAVARRVGFQAGQPVRICWQDSAVLVSPAGERNLTLTQRLALFDPERHGGEAMMTPPVGREILGPPRKKANYLLSHQPQSFDWLVRGASPHPQTRVPEDAFALACKMLNQIVEIGD